MSSPRCPACANPLTNDEPGPLCATCALLQVELAKGVLDALTDELLAVPLHAADDAA